MARENQEVLIITVATIVAVVLVTMFFTAATRCFDSLQPLGKYNKHCDYGAAGTVVLIEQKPYLQCTCPAKVSR